MTDNGGPAWRPIERERKRICVLPAIFCLIAAPAWGQSFIECPTCGKGSVTSIPILACDDPNVGNNMCNPNIHHVPVPARSDSCANMTAYPCQIVDDLQKAMDICSRHKDPNGEYAADWREDCWQIGAAMQRRDPEHAFVSRVVKGLTP